MGFAANPVEAAFWYRKAKEYYDSEDCLPQTKAHVARFLAQQRCFECGGAAKAGGVLCACTGCCAAVYCDGACQKKHYKAHKASCRRGRKLRAAILSAASSSVAEILAGRGASWSIDPEGKLVAETDA